MKKLVFLIFYLNSVFFYSQTLSSSLTACYALDGSATEPVNNLTGTLSAVTATLDRFNNANAACYFNGTNSCYVKLPDDPALKPSNAISFSCWVKPAVAGNGYILFTRNSLSSFFEAYNLCIAPHNSGWYFMTNKSGPGGYNVVFSSNPISVNTWQHLVFTMDNSSIKLYVNGVLDGTTAVTFSGFDYVSGKNVYLGSTNESSYNTPYNGSIDNARFYNRVLSASEVSQLYLTDPSCTFPTLNCNSIFYSTATGSTGIYANSTTGSTLYPSVLPSGAEGLAIGPAFSFPAPNPTFWTTAGGTYWYHNGNTFVNTGHGTGNAAALSPGGSKTRLYNITAGGQVYVYTGTGTGTLLTTIFVNGNVSDIVGDDLDNFYVLSCCGTSTLRLYDPAGSWLCTYTPNSATVIASNGSAGGLAILNNTVVTHTGNLPGLQTGTLSGSLINFSTNTLVTGFADYANCPLPSGFISSITASPVSSITCYNPTITLTASDNNFFGPSTYTWSGPGVISSPNSQSISVTSAGVYSCFLRSCPGYTSMSTFTVNTNNSFSINVSASSPSLCSGAAGVTLTASGASVYTWTPSTSLSNTLGTAVIATPSVSSTYTVSGFTTLCSANAVITITVFPKPVVTVPSPTIGVCAGTSSLVSAASPFPLTYHWVPGNMNGQTVSISPPGSTIYTVTGTDAAGCSSTATLSALIQATPALQVISLKNPKCPYEQVVLLASGANSYTWLPGSVNTPSISASASVTSVYSVTGINAFGCTNTLLYTMSVSPQSTILITSPNLTICSGKTASLLASGSSNYSWSPSSSLSGTLGPLVYANPSVTTIYTVNSNNSVCNSSAIVTVSVIPNPSISLSEQLISICPGGAASFTAFGAGNYTWLPSNQTGSIFNANPGSSVTYTLLGSNGNNCVTSTTAGIVVNNYPILQITLSSASLCAGESATITAQGASNYTWLPSGVSGSSIVVSPSASATYSLIGSNGVCTGSLAFVVMVKNCKPKTFFGLTNAVDNPVPFQSRYYRVNFTVIAVNTSSLNLSSVVLNSELNKTFPYPCTYTVVSAPRIHSINSSLVANNSFDGASQSSLTYSVTSVLKANKKDTLVYSVLIEPNGFYGPVKNSVIGFVTMPDNTVRSDSSNNGFVWDPDNDGDPTNNNIATWIDIKPIELFIPEGFSPNDDGENDVFVITGLSGKNARLTIYNRWGNKVYIKEGSELTWDGKVNVSGLKFGNDKLPASTYFYTLEFLEGDKHTLTGFIVMRY